MRGGVKGRSAQPGPVFFRSAGAECAARAGWRAMAEQQQDFRAGARWWNMEAARQFAAFGRECEDGLWRGLPGSTAATVLGFDDQSRAIPQAQQWNDSEEVNAGTLSILHFVCC